MATKRQLTVWGSNARLCKIHGSIQHFRNSKITKNKTTITKQENILCFEVSMEHFVGMHIVQAQRQLDEPMQNLGFGEQVALCSFNLRCQVSL